MYSVIVEEIQKTSGFWLLLVGSRVMRPSSLVNHDSEVCEESYLQLNKSKTKDMIIDLRKHAHTHEVVSIQGQKGNVLNPTNILDNYWPKTEFWCKLWSHVKKGAPMFLLFEETFIFFVSTLTKPWWTYFIKLLLNQFDLFIWCHGLKACKRLKNTHDFSFFPVHGGI